MRQNDPRITKAIWIFVFASLILTPLGGIILVVLYLVRSGFIQKDNFNLDDKVMLKKEEYKDYHPKPDMAVQYEDENTFYDKIPGLSPEEVIELDRVSHDEFSHNIYHESNKTVHNSNGVFLIYNATRKEYYLGSSKDTLRTICRLLRSNRNILGSAYQNGDALRIKIMAADGHIFMSNAALILDIESRYPVIKI